MKEQLRQKPGARLRGAGAIILSGGLAVLLAAGAWLTPVRAASTPDSGRPEVASAAPKTAGSSWAGSTEAGGGFGRYDHNLGNSDNEFVRLGLSRPWRYGAVLDVGREHRFNETSFNYGASYTQFLPGRINLTVAGGSGTGQVLAPRWRLGVTASGSVWKLVPSAGYVHTQSKAVNRSDQVSLGLLCYAGHWILGGSGRQDYGHPGDTSSRSWGVGLTWYQWRRNYIGVNVDWGKVSYMLVDPAVAKVNFNSTAIGLGYSHWFADNYGVNLRGSYGRTSFYKVGGATLSWFWEW
jgi:YaiO family outer membrane protein